MSKQLGVWIDHHNAVIVTLKREKADLTRIDSKTGKHVRFSGAPQGKAEDQRDRRATGHLNRYYDEVVAAVRGADTILVLGPGEAKGELTERLRRAGLGDRVAGPQTVDKMTDPQIVAHVRTHFREALATA